MKLFIVIIIFIFGISSCTYSDKDFNMNETDLSFLNAFKKGDTLCYENSKMEFEKFLVLGLDSNQKKEYGTLMAKPAFNEFSVNIKHLGKSIFQNSLQKLNSENFDTIAKPIFIITKYPQNKETSYFFAFNHFYSNKSAGIGELHKDTIINKLKIESYYILRESSIYSSDTSRNEIDLLYWTQKDGMVAYKQKNGTYWTKKNNH